MESADSPDAYDEVQATLARVADLPEQPASAHRHSAPEDWLDPEVVAQIAQNIAAQMPKGTHLYMLENGQAWAVFRLTALDATKLNHHRPGLLTRLNA